MKVPGYRSRQPSTFNLQPSNLQPAARRLVIFLDEIDVVRSLPFSTDEFFAAIRECYNRRTEDPLFHQVTFCLLGVATPSDLIRDTRMTPFNIGTRIELNDFTQAEASPLALGLTHHRAHRERREGEPESDELKVMSDEKGAVVTHHSSLISHHATPDAQRLLERILYWTGGHPYLTQRLCQAVVERLSTPTPTTHHPTPALVDRLCEELFLSARAREQDDNLIFVRERLLKTEVDLASVLDLYRQVRTGKRVAADDTNQLVDILRLSGITRIREYRHPRPSLVVRNRIYAHVFDREWVAPHMPDAEVRRQRAAFRRGLTRAGVVSGLILAVIAGLALTAMQNARQAAEGQRTLRRFLYGAQVNLAQQAWEVGDNPGAVELLDRQRPRRGQEDLRAFEWRYLWRLCQSEALATLRGHTQSVVDVAFSPDGKTLATCGDDTVRLWDVASRRELADFRVPLWGGGRPLAFSPDGRTLAVGSGDRWVKLWNVARRREVATLKGFDGPVWFVLFSPDGKRLVTGSHRTLAGGRNERGFKLWDVATRRELATRPGLHFTYWTASASHDGKTLATPGADEKTIDLWDPASGREIAILRGRPGQVNALAFSPDGKTVASTGEGRRVRLWDVATKREVAALTGHQAVTTAVAYAPDGKTLASGGSDGMVKLWDATSKEELATYRGHRRTVWGVAFSPDGKTLATASEDRTVKFWDVTSRDASILRGHTRGIWSLRFTPDGKTLASRGMDDTVKLWDVDSRRELATFRVPFGDRHSMALSPDGRTLAAGSSEKWVKLWDVASRREVGVLSGHTDEVASVAFSPDGRTLACGVKGGTVVLWDVASRRKVSTIKTRQKFVVYVAFSPDGKTLATGAMPTDKRVKLWDLVTRREVATLEGHEEGVTTVEFAPDGKTLASSSWDRSVKLWDVATRREVPARMGHAAIVDALTFSPDGKTLATAGADDVVRLWDLATKQQVAALAGHRSQVWSLAFSRDGNVLATGGADNTIRLWRAATLQEADAPPRQQPAQVLTRGGPARP